MEVLRSPDAALSARWRAVTTLHGIDAPAEDYLATLRELASSAVHLASLGPQPAVLLARVGSVDDRSRAVEGLTQAARDGAYLTDVLAALVAIRDSAADVDTSNRVVSLLDEIGPPEEWYARTRIVSILVDLGEIDRALAIAADVAQQGVEQAYEREYLVEQIAGNLRGGIPRERLRESIAPWLASEARGVRLVGGLVLLGSDYSDEGLNALGRLLGQESPFLAELLRTAEEGASPSIRRAAWVRIAALTRRDVPRDPYETLACGAVVARISTIVGMSSSADDDIPF